MADRFNKAHVNALASFAPVNSLNGNKRNQPRRMRSPPPCPPSPPLAKRRKVDDYGTHTQSHFALLPEHDRPVDRPISRKRSFDDYSDSQQTLRSQLSNTKGAQSTQTNVTEYRTSEKYVRAQRGKRYRRDVSELHGGRSNGEIDGVSFLDPNVGDSDGDVEVIERPESMTTSQERQTEEVREPIDVFGKRFLDQRTAAALKMEDIIDTTVSKTKSKSVESSPDELAPKAQDMRGKMRTKWSTTPSASLSQRGDIRQTKFLSSSHAGPQSSRENISSFDRAAKIIASPLRIIRAVSGPYKYESGGASSAKECFLSLRKMSFILHPVDSACERMNEYAYLTVDLHSTHAVRWDSQEPKCRIISIDRALTGSIHGSRKLMIEFPSPKELSRFIEWAQMDGKDAAQCRITFSTDYPIDRLKKELENMMTKATKTTLIADSDPRGDDVKLIEHNAAAVKQRYPNPLHMSTRNLKLKDMMRSGSSASLASLPRSEVTVIPDDPKPLDIQRQPRTTRSTFTLKSPSTMSESPEPEGWTTQNEGWEKNWRNSLVFPPHGKGRATVDKEDILRLDEGQFLNDNLIIFYLRYLQHTLEAERPDLARRIYFQNTFFYEKLKSTRTSQGINYDSVKAWTSKVDLFSKDYIIVPINEFSHWYVAIIYNAPKLLPSLDKTEDTEVRAKEAVSLEGEVDSPRRSSSTSPHGRKSGESGHPESMKSTVENEVIRHLSRMSINSQTRSDSDTKHTAATEPEKQNPDIQEASHEGQNARGARDEDDHKEKSKVDLEQTVTVPSNSNTGRKRTGKGYNTGTRKYSPDQPKIITLDSLGLSHSPACRCLKQYLVAELKDKKGIEIPTPGALGMTAKNVPQQTNHCDCGLYLLGYIQEFLKDPDEFVPSILQHRDIAWNLNPSELRNEIRNLIFTLQKEQQDREDAHKEEKRSKAASLKRGKSPIGKQQPLKQVLPPVEEQVANRGVSEPRKQQAVLEEANMIRTKPMSLPPEVPHPETKPRSNLEKKHHVPGSFPQSPGTESTNAEGYRAGIGTNSGGGIEIQKFVSPLPESDSGSSPTRPMAVEDSEIAQRSRRDPDHGHVRRESRQANLPVKSIEVPDPSCGDHDRSGNQFQSRGEAPTKSPYFAGRQPGDRMASAKLRGEPTESRIIVDISD